MNTNNERIYIVRFGEVSLKGQNKSYFEKLLVERLRKLLKKFPGVRVNRQEGLIFYQNSRRNNTEGCYKRSLKSIRNSLDKSGYGSKLEYGRYISRGGGLCKGYIKQ